VIVRARLALRHLGEVQGCDWRALDLLTVMGGEHGGARAAAKPGDQQGLTRRMVGPSGEAGRFIKRAHVGSKLQGPQQTQSCSSTLRAAGVVGPQEDGHRPEAANQSVISARAQPPRPRALE